MKRVIFSTLAIGLLVSPVAFGAVSDEDIEELREQLAVRRKSPQRRLQTFRPTLPRQPRHLQQPTAGRIGSGSMAISATATRESMRREAIRAGETGSVRGST
jgi:hypothetical protein